MHCTKDQNWLTSYYLPSFETIKATHTSFLPKQFNELVFPFLQDHYSHLNQYIWMCFPSFKTIYQMLHCVEPNIHIPTTFHIYAIYDTYFCGIYWECMCIYVLYMKSVATPMKLWRLYTYTVNWILCYWHRSFNKYSCYIANSDHSALILHGHTGMTLIHMWLNTTTCNIYLTWYCHKFTRKKYINQTAYICHIVGWHIWEFIWSHRH